MSSKILITGSHGYVGSVLTPALIKAGYEVVGYDLQIFGDHLGEMKGLTTVKADIRDIDSFRKAVEGCDAVLHLACVSNDPSFELDADLSKSVNYDCFEPMVIAAKEAGVKRFIYCSTSSVYGISDAPDVTEDHPFVPITLYNRYKGMCEPLLLKHQSDDFVCTILRPATVCGYSPRMRLDLSVNILTNLAVNKSEITVFGGAQMRPNIHIEDMVRAYLAVLEAPAEQVAGQAFNVGLRNISIRDLAEIVRDAVENRYGKPVNIRTEHMADQRSYRVNSEKIKRVLDFKFQHTVEDAILDVCAAFDRGDIPDSMYDDVYFNVRRMKSTFPALYAGARPSAMDATSGVMSEIDLHRMGRL